MKRRIALLAVLAAPAVLMASCADSEDAAAPTDPPPAHVFEEAAAPEAEADAGVDAPAMDASGFDWHIVGTNVSPFFVLKAIWGTAKNDVWAAGSGGAIAHYDGTAWAVVPSGVEPTFNAIWGSGPDDVYLVADVDAVYHTDHTAKLTSIPTGATGAKVNSVWGSSADNVRVGTDYVSFYDEKGNYQSGVQFARASAPVDAGDAGGPSWKAMRLDANGDQFGTTVRSIWGASANDLWISASQLDTPGREGITYHGLPDDGGIAFTEVDSQSSNTLEAIHGTSAKDVWAVGSGGAIRHFTGAERWQVVPSPTRETLHAVFAIAPNDVWAAGDHGTILHYDGSAFTVSSAEMPADRSPALYGIWGSGPNDVWVVGDAIALHHGMTP